MDFSPSLLVFPCPFLLCYFLVEIHSVVIFFNGLFFLLGLICHKKPFLGASKWDGVFSIVDGWMDGWAPFYIYIFFFIGRWPCLYSSSHLKASVLLFTDL